MPHGDKSGYTDKQKRKAMHIEENYEDRGVSEEESLRRASATMNATDHGGKKSGSGREMKCRSGSAKSGGQQLESSSKKKTLTRKRERDKSGPF